MATRLRARGVGGIELSRDLEALKVGLSRQLTAIRREAAELVAARTRANTPVGPGPRPGAKHPDDRLPHLRDTIAARASGVATTHPAGVVFEFGGTISPRGTPITIRAHRMAERAGTEQREQVEELMARRVGELLERELT